MLEFLLAICAALGLSAACGFRVFVPPLMAAIASRAGAVRLGGGFEWLDSDIALVMLTLATIVECVGYFVPWLDNLLDAIATPAAAVAGVLMAGSMVSEVSPWFAWTIAAISGGSIASAVQVLTVATRATSTAATGGLTNFVVAIAEGVGSVLLSILSIFAPILGGIAAAALLYFVYRRARAIRAWWKARGVKSTASESCFAPFTQTVRCGKCNALLVVERTTQASIVPCPVCKTTNQLAAMPNPTPGSPFAPEPKPESFRDFLWEAVKHPLYNVGGNPLAQSAAAFGINVWCLVLAVLAQFWVILSAALLLGQLFNTWSVSNGRMARAPGLAIGLVIVVINVLALLLAVLGQLWVFVSAGLAIWQYVSLIRVCLQKRET
jgi:phage FluMu protein Com